MTEIIAAQDLGRWRQWAQTQAIATDISVEEVDWFLQGLTSVDRLSLRLGIREAVQSQVSLAELSQLWERRCQEKVPVQYLVGKAPWRNFELFVSPAVLIPRPETEYLIDLARTSPTNLHAGHWVDLGTGSGAIALGLAESFVAATIHAVDQSAAALGVARKNAIAYGFQNRIQFYQGSWWEPLQHLRGQVAGMVSNPPYIPAALLPDLQPEVYRHEPHSALDGGTDGLADLRILVNEAPDYLVSGGIWLVEMMRGQGEAVAQLLADNGRYTQIQIIDDFAGGDRYVSAQRI
ncbi:protein-(glutamine-N5) methyltransferase, release factor-specific [Picosynechococcus sp. PCC 7003]|uniref:peptide chain release factor N(5)-glutamine methyltransferase n=1 Tax=Picosynechococcus sp. PCC 7003 TaxID=374981 RepID=UPI000810D6BA|nr:peptide chain release factor N(5)-glutamine methyltransferase [Picosynechococcus sp. PCC 7003]ANV84377.1 protein-(glutamine-N5) methyltransferase, release factor-specific [Picosynechococcus sp. PCC 7003]